MTDPWARPADQAPPVPPQPQFPHSQPPGGQGAPLPPSAPPEQNDSPLDKVKSFFRDPLSIVLVAVIVLALVLAGVLGGELYARSRADAVVSRVVSCVVQDEAKVSFGAVPPFLWQHMTGHYTNITVQTAGNQIRQANGMKVDMDIKDVRLEDTATTSGSVGSLRANITWSSEGIKQTIQNAIPLVGSFLTGVSTNPSAGTIELQGALGSITAKPAVADNGISLQITELTGLGFTLPRETVQPALDAFTAQLTKNYPMGIHADSVQVTDSGVVSQFSTQNASIPKGQQDPCFSGI
ncbi:LmeA family phospholipid-binding protein [Mycobacterium sp. MMS18-G62]